MYSPVFLDISEIQWTDKILINILINCLLFKRRESQFLYRIYLIKAKFSCFFYCRMLLSDLPGLWDNRSYLTVAFHVWPNESLNMLMKQPLCKSVLKTQKMLWRKCCNCSEWQMQDWTPFFASLKQFCIVYILLKQKFWIIFLSNALPLNWFFHRFGLSLHDSLLAFKYKHGISSSTSVTKPDWV